MIPSPQAPSLVTAKRPRVSRSRHARLEAQLRELSAELHAVRVQTRAQVNRLEAAVFGKISGASGEATGG